jgi:hypothetical protein
MKPWNIQGENQLETLAGSHLFLRPAQYWWKPPNLQWLKNWCDDPMNKRPMLVSRYVIGCSKLIIFMIILTQVVNI